jgi:holo-[acyl-carrier protein] synthase
MIFGFGTDIVEVNRIQDKLEKNTALIQHIYSQQEQEYCNKQKHPHISYAARFAVKEAFLKAFGVKFIGNHSLPEIAISNDEHGKPTVVLSGKTLNTFQQLQLQNIHVSISHTDMYAVASVIIEK